MGKTCKEEKINCKVLSQNRWDIHLEIMRLKKIKNKSEKEYKSLINNCNELVRLCKILTEHGYKEWTHNKYSQAEYWKKELDKYLEINVVKLKPKKQNTVDIQNDKENLYYITLCWTSKQNYFVCDNIIENVKNYFERIKTSINIEYMDTMEDKFPDRTEYTSTYKLRSNKDIYNLIISSTEYILDTLSSSAYDKCNIGIFGKKIE